MRCMQRVRAGTGAKHGDADGVGLWVCGAEFGVLLG